MRTGFVSRPATSQKTKSTATEIARMTFGRRRIAPSAEAIDQPPRGAPPEVPLIMARLASQKLPDFLPAQTLRVQLSGLTEIAAGVLRAIPRLSAVGAWCIIAHLLVFLLVHFNMAAKPDDYADFASPAALYLRIPIQFVMIAWAFWFTRETASVPIEHTDDGT